MTVTGKTLKVVLALILVVMVMLWAISSIRTMTYSGANLDFGVGSGAVTLTNDTDTPIGVQLVSPGTRSFAVETSIDGVGGISVREGLGNTSVHVFGFMLPVGETILSLTRGSNVRFVSLSDAPILASVEPVNAQQSRSTLIAMSLMIIGALIYISYVTEHAWINLLRGKQGFVPEPIPTNPIDGGQGQVARSYGDNRSKRPNS